MPDKDAVHGHGEQSLSEAWKTAATVLQDAAPFIARTRFVVTMMCAPGAPMLELVDEKELAERAQLRAPRPTR